MSSPQFKTPLRYKKYCDRKLKIIKNFIKKSDKILDAGCGDKKHQYSFLSLSEEFNVVGVDLDSSWNSNVIKGDITNLNFNNESFDVVLCLDVLEHVKEWKAAFDELIRVAKKRIIVVVPTTENKIFYKITQFLRKITGVNNPIFHGHFRDYFPSQIINLSKNKGLSCKLFKVEFSTRLFSKLLKRYNFRYGGIYVIEFSL